MVLLAGTKKSLVIAHRGSSGKAPENSLSAYKQAWLEKSDAIEIDLRMTKDKHFVCCHDNNLNRVSSSKKTISSLNLTDLKEIDIGLWKSKKFKNETIPTLEEVLAKTPKRKKIFIEIKGALKEHENLFQIIEQSKFKKENFHFLSYLPAVVKLLKKRYSEYPATLNLIPSLYNYDFEKILSIIKKSKSNGISLHVDSFKSINLIKKIKNLDQFVICWTVNDLRFMKSLLKIKVNGIITDYPEKLVRLLEK